MSSKQQLMDYNKRLKKVIEEKNVIITNQLGAIENLKFYAELYAQVVSKRRMPWWKKIFK